MNRFLLLPIFAYFLLSPFYIFPSGMPQISDMIITLGILVFLLRQLGTKGLRFRKVFFIGICFALLTIVINLINYASYPHVRFLMSSLYYPFNLLVFIYIVKVMEEYGETLRPILCKLIYIVVFVEVLYAIVMPQDHWRELGSFQNPNQLAYWSILTATSLVLLKYGRKLNVMDIIIIGLCGFMQMMALSKAGIITFTLFSMILLFSPSLNAYTRSIFVFILVLIVITVSMSAAYVLENSEHIQNTVARLQNIGMEADDSLEGRGYNRMWEHPVYLLFGSGEGAFERFGKPYELHSGIGTIFFSYGIFGAGLFFAFLYSIFRKRSLYILALFVPVLMFGIPAQSFRFTHFWVFLAILYVSKDYIKGRAQNVLRRET